jgi:hypothetical protein
MHRSRFYETAEILSEKVFFFVRKSFFFLSEKVLSKLIFLGQKGFLKLTPEGDQKIVG